MKSVRKLLVLLFFILPMIAKASGQGVIEIIFTNFFVLIIVVIAVMLIRLDTDAKFFLIGIYIISSVLTFVAVPSVPSQDTIVLFVPLIIVTLSYLILKYRLNRK